MKTVIIMVLFWSIMIGGHALELEQNLRIEILQQLNFGRISVSSFGGTISLSPSQHPLETTTGGVYAPTDASRRAAQLQLRGPADTMVFISLHDSSTLHAENGTNEPLSLQLTLNSPLRHLGPNGRIDDVYIGGTLTIDPNQPASSYRGEFTVMVDYQ